MGAEERGEDWLPESEDEPAREIRKRSSGRGNNRHSRI